MFQILENKSRKHSQRSSSPLAATDSSRSGRSKRSFTMLTAKHIVYGLDCYHTSCWTDKKEHPNPWKPQKHPPTNTWVCRARSFTLSNFSLSEIFWTFSASKQCWCLKTSLKISKAANAPSWFCSNGIHISCHVVLKNKKLKNGLKYTKTGLWR